MTGTKALPTKVALEDSHPLALTSSRKVSLDLHLASTGNKKKPKLSGMDDDHFEEIKVEKVSHALSESI